MSKIVCKGFQRVIKEGQRVKIIELGNYNAAAELLIEKRNTESLSLVHHRDIEPDGKGTMAAVYMEERGVVMRV